MIRGDRSTGCGEIGSVQQGQKAKRWGGVEEVDEEEVEKTFRG
jgi:hypothetical protein